jgi:hypothetical protein
MKHITFEALSNKATKFKQADIEWHFHMISPKCIFSQSKEQYQIIVENQSSDEVLSSYFSENPKKETRQMAELLYGPDFLTKEENTDEAIPVDQKFHKNDAFQTIMKAAKACRDSGAAWHNHHFPPQCILNVQEGKHCIVFEDETADEALYAYFEENPLEALSELEKIYFAK